MIASPSDDFSKVPPAREFLDAVGPMLPAYRNGLLTYVGMNYGGETVILYARLQLSVDAHAPDKAPFGTANLFAGQYCIEGLEPAAIQSCMLHAVTHRYLPPVNGHPLKLVPKSDTSPGDYDAYYDRQTLQQRLARNDHSVDRVLLSGLSRYQMHNQHLNELERELHTFGLDTIEQLIRMYGLNPRDQTTLEVTTTPVATFAKGCSLIGQRLTLHFRLAFAVDRTLLKVFVRNAEAGNSELPRAFDDASIHWTREGAWLKGSLTTEFAEPLIVDCRLTYAGRPQAELRLFDPHSLPNPRRMLVDLVDPGADRIAQLVLAPRKEQGRDFETAIAWLLHLLGFECLHVSAMSNLTEEPDILAVSPGGEILLVECTTKVPDDEKVTKLVSRTERMRNIRQRRLNSDASSSAAIVPILVCSLPPDELRGMRAKAADHSIVVLCQPELQDALRASQFAPDPARQLRTWLEKPLMQLLTGERRLGLD